MIGPVGTRFARWDFATPKGNRRPGRGEGIAAPVASQPLLWVAVA